ncbi:MAG: Cytochrome c-550 [Planctomycetota bacterium]
MVESRSNEVNAERDGAWTALGRCDRVKLPGRHLVVRGNALMPPRTSLLAATAALALLTACGGEPNSPPGVAPVVVGPARVELQGAALGRVLLSELGCVACHAPASAYLEPAPRGPNLATVASRVRSDYLQRFLADPHATEPGTPMPDLPGARTATERAADAAALTAYLGSLPAEPLADEPFAADAATRGKTLYHAIGCVACHAPRDEAGAEQPLALSTPTAELTAKYTRVSLREFLLAPHDARPAQRMPTIAMTPAEARDLAHFLVPSTSPTVAPAAPDAALVARGRGVFERANCAACHGSPETGIAAAKHRTLADLNPQQGCLSGRRGAWPHYALTDEQSAAIRAALAEANVAPTAAARSHELLASRDCYACHNRNDLGGLTLEREPFFGTDDPNLGGEARVPPTLTGVGAKLTDAWLRNTIAHGQRARPYMHTRMPGFGDALGNRLTDLFGATDTLPPITLREMPQDGDAARKERDLGRELVGDKGMNCITCHRFAGEQSGSMGAVDLVESTGQRLRPEWFAHFLRAPFAFKPNTLMPQFFPNGVSTRPELGDGDVDRQIAAMWHYLAEGRNVRAPSGMRRPPIELKIDERTVILRRSLQDTGKRGIAVGLPGGVNVAFDAERLAMNQVWWGRFVDAAPVWTSQGSGQARILGDRRTRLPDGPAIAALADAQAAWPTESRRQLGHAWLGYDLDDLGRPTFRYRVGDVEIADAPVQTTPSGETRPTLQRIVRATAKTDVDLWLLAARDARIEPLGDGAYRVGDRLRIAVRGPAATIVTAGDAKELRLPIAVRNGGCELQIDYAWLEDGK